MLLQSFIQHIILCLGHKQNFSHHFSFRLSFACNRGHDVRWPAFWFSEPCRTFPPQLRRFVYTSSSATKVSGVLIGTDISLDEAVLLDFLDSVCHKLPVITISFNPVQRDATIQPTVDTFHWESCQGFFHVVDEVCCHMSGY